MSDQKDLSGVWRSHYKFTSSQRKSEFDVEHLMKAHRRGNWLTLETTGEKNESYLLVRLHIDDNVATGTWEEQTDKEGYYEGTVYHGAVQLLIAPDGKRMEGKWVGIGHDAQINVGPWDFTFVGEASPSES